MREVWTVNLNGEPDEVTTLPGDGTVSACAWSDDGLVAFSSQRTAVARGGFTSSPAIYVMHVDHPERHAQLCGGHEQAVSQLNWVHRQLGVVLMSADERSYICIWKPVQGLINRWELHHRLQFSAVKLAQFLNQPLQCTQPPPYFPGNEPQLNAYDAAVNPPPVAGAPPLAYGAKYGVDAAGRPLSVAGGVNATPADKKDLQNIPGCLALLAVSRLGELKVFVQLSQGGEKGGGGEWVATSVNLSSHVLPDTTSRSVSRGSAGGSEAGGSGSQAVLCVEAAIVNVRNGRNGSLLLAVSQQSQILLFAVKCTYWPLKVTATPHTRTQLKSDIRLQGLAAPKPMLSPHLLHMCFNPTRPDDLLVIYRMTQALETVRGGHLRLERLRLKEKAGVQSAASTDPAQRARAGATAVEAWQWVLDARMLLTDGAEGGDATVTHLSVTRDGQFLVLFWASGTVQLRLLDSLQQPPTGTYKIHLATPVRSESAGKGAGKIQEEGRQNLWGAVMASCGPGSGNCLLLIDACGKAKLVELPHPWSGAQQVSVVHGLYIRGLMNPYVRLRSFFDVCASIHQSVHPQSLYAFTGRSLFASRLACMHTDSQANRQTCIQARTHISCARGHTQTHVHGCKYLPF